MAVAVAQASGYSSDWTPSLGTSICHRCGPRKDKKKRKRKKERKTNPLHLLLPFPWPRGPSLFPKYDLSFKDWLRITFLSASYQTFHGYAPDSCAQVAITNTTDCPGLNNRHSFSHGSGGLKSKIKVPGFVSGENPLFGL